jgi:hypothetical protein
MRIQRTRPRLLGCKALRARWPQCHKLREARLHQLGQEQMREGRQVPRVRLSFGDGATDQPRLRGMGTLGVRLQPVLEFRNRAGQFLGEGPAGLRVRSKGVLSGVRLVA